MITFGKLKVLSFVDETYSCVMETPNRIVLKAQRYRGKDGRERPNGLSFTAFGKTIGIKQMGPA